MSRLCWVVLGFALLGTARCDDSTEDTDGDGELGEPNSLEEIGMAAGLNEDFREQNSPECTLLDPTDNEPTKYLLDVNVWAVCNDYVNDAWGDCNCPENMRCGSDGITEESQIYYCRSLGASDSDQYSAGLILGEYVQPQVSIVQGFDKK